MSRNYRYDHRISKNRKRQSFLIVLISLIIVGVLGIVLTNFVNKSTKDSNSTVNGPAKVVGQAAPSGSAQTTLISEPDYSFSIPNTWKQFSSTGTSSGPGSIITWRSGKSDDSTRTMTIYEDAIPKTYALNLLMPVTANGASLNVGSISSNCADFTTYDPSSNYNPNLSKWDGVSFLCNTPDRFDDQVGTGSAGSNINSVTVTGPLKGAHSYFFLYIDRYAEPNYSIFYSMLDSFKAN